MERNWDLEERLCEVFGIVVDSPQETLVMEILKKLDVDTMNDVLETIATDYEVSTGDNE